MKTIQEINSILQVQITVPPLSPPLKPAYTKGVRRLYKFLLTENVADSVIIPVSLENIILYVDHLIKKCENDKIKIDSIYS